jgi:ferredoxin
LSAEIPVPQLGFPKIYQVVKNVLFTACGGCEAICPANYDKFSPTVAEPSIVKLYSLPIL